MQAADEVLLLRPSGLSWDLAAVAAQLDGNTGVYDATDARGGYVSFEVDPRLARDTQGTIAAARDLSARIERPNVMIKVPGTPEGLPAITELLAAGVNVNVTLLFSVDAYERVAEAYLAGLEARLEGGEAVDRVASVASFLSWTRLT